MKIPYISERQVRRVLTIPELLPVLERAFREKNTAKVQLPPKPYLFFEKERGDLRIMPCYWQTVGLASVKLVNAHPLNPERYGLPSVTAHLLLYNPKNGLPLCAMGATALTALRTGAMGALAARYLAPKQSRVVGMIGTGVQAVTQIEGLLAVRPIERVQAYSKDPLPLAQFLKTFKKRVEIVPCKTVPEACEEADILATTTPSKRPVVHRGDVKKGALILAIGADAPFKQELDPAILRKARVIVDDLVQAKHGGEINVPLRKGDLAEKDIAGEFSDLLTKKIRPPSDSEITVFDSTGLALQDIAAASLVYKKIFGKSAKRS